LYGLVINRPAVRRIRRRRELEMIGIILAHDRITAALERLAGLGGAR